MSGFGERFRKVGYRVPKPLILVDNKTIVEHVIDLFPGETDFTFICNQDHLDDPDYKMREILTTACPTGQIVGIPPHKLGPVHAVQSIVDDLNADEPVIVNYCDFSQLWSYQEFKAFVAETNCDGCLPSYRGFHPHSLGSTFYAYLKLDAADERLADIQEKQPWTDDPKAEFASSGTYYFKSAAMMKAYFDKCVEQDLNVNGEFYVSMVYRPMAYDGLDIRPYDLEHFMQWGTPGDLREYQAWDRFFRLYNDGLPPSNRAKADGTLVIPMAGLGSRFVAEGYKAPKPLISVGRQTMVERAITDMPTCERLVVVTRKDLQNGEQINAVLQKTFSGIDLVQLEALSDGQAISCLAGLRNLSERQMREPLTIAACDNGVVFDADNLSAKTQMADCLVWGYRGHAAAQRKPESYSWIDADAEGNVSRIGVKELCGDPATTPIVIGAFTFRSAAVYQASVEALIAKDIRVNGEFYADSVPNILLSNGMKVAMFEVEHYVSFGTPDELRTYEYWYDCFSKWGSHPLTKPKHV